MSCTGFCLEVCLQTDGFWGLNKLSKLTLTPGQLKLIQSSLPLWIKVLIKVLKVLFLVPWPQQLPSPAIWYVA